MSESILSTLKRKDYRCPLCGTNHILLGNKFVDKQECYALACKNYNETTNSYTKEQYVKLADTRENLTGAECLTGEAIIVDVKDLETALMFWKPYCCITPISISDTYANNLSFTLDNKKQYTLTQESFN